MKYYVVADVHGYYTYLKKALSEAGFFDETEPCRLVVCGDLLDRGEEANELVAFMVRLLEENKLIYILGNHEDLLVQCLQELARGDGVRSHHFQNKTWDSLLQLGKMNGHEALSRPYELIRRVTQSPFYKKLLPAAVDYYETAGHVFVHGWIPCTAEGYRPHMTYKYDPDWRNDDIAGWQRARWFNGMELACKYHITEPGKTVVCGHWHASYGHSQIHHTCSEWGSDADFSPFRAEGVLAIDASTPNSLTVNCVVIEDRESGE